MKIALVAVAIDSGMVNSVADVDRELADIRRSLPSFTRHAVAGVATLALDHGDGVIDAPDYAHVALVEARAILSPPTPVTANEGDTVTLGVGEYNSIIERLAALEARS